MAIRNFFQESQQAIQTGLGLGDAIKRAQQDAVFNPLRQQAMEQENVLRQQRIDANPLTMQSQDVRTTEMQRESDQKQSIKDLIIGLKIKDYDRRNEFLSGVAANYGDESRAGIEELQKMDDKTQIETMLNLLKNSGSGSDPATSKLWDKYQSIENPEDKVKFGIAAGFDTSGTGKRLFKVAKNDDGSITKYYSDGSEEVSSPTEKVKTPDMSTKMSVEQAQIIIDKAKEGQLKNAGFALTMADGVAQVEALKAKGFDPSSVGWVQKYLAGTTPGNLALSPDEQIYVGAIEQMINAISRRETGAAITEFEKKDFFNRYMPTAGDSKERLKQKDAALKRQFKSIRGQAGSAYDAIRITQGFDNQSNDIPQEVQQSLYKEGQTATNPSTGEKLIFTNGQWVKK